MSSKVLTPPRSTPSSSSFLEWWFCNCPFLSNREPASLFPLITEYHPDLLVVAGDGNEVDPAVRVCPVSRTSNTSVMIHIQYDVSVGNGTRCFCTYWYIYISLVQCQGGYEIQVASFFLSLFFFPLFPFIGLRYNKHDKEKLEPASTLSLREKDGYIMLSKTVDKPFLLDKKAVKWFGSKSSFHPDQETWRIMWSRSAIDCVFQAL